MRSTRYAQFNVKVAALMLAWVGAVAVLNYVVDPYSIFGTPYFPRPFEHNLHFIKIEELKHHHSDYNSYVLGSSRAGAIDVRTIEQYLPGSRFFNLAVIGATQQDNLKHIEYLTANHYAVRNLYIQVDLDFLTHQIRGDRLEQLLHPDVTRESRVQYYLKYLLVIPNNAFVQKVKTNLENWRKGQKPRGEREEARRAADPRERHHTRQQLQHVTENLRALRHVKELCDWYTIRCIVFVSPLHHRLLQRLNKDVYLGALEALGMVTEFYDFGGCNSVTMNDDNYFEPMHYRPHVGDWMAVRIFGDAGASVPRDFGVLVTRDNLRQHLANMRGMLMSISDSRSNW